MTGWLQRLLGHGMALGRYPYGSVPYGDGESVALRVRRVACAAMQHHPRHYDGSWCWGYGYVCGRCYMYADPWSPQEADARALVLNTTTPDQSRVADVCRLKSVE